MSPLILDKSKPSPSPRRGEGEGEEILNSASRAALYRLVATGFAYPESTHLPTNEGMEAARALGLESVAELIARLESEARRLGVDRKHEYEQLVGFGGGGDVSLYETEHVGQEVFRKSRDLADLAGFYKAFGMRLNDSDRERADHLSVEAEFLAWLCVKQAVAHSEGLIEKAALCREAEVRFLEAHFLRWVPRLADRIAAQTEGLYHVLARLTGAVVQRVSQEKEVA